MFGSPESERLRDFLSKVLICYGKRKEQAIAYIEENAGLSQAFQTRSGISGAFPEGVRSAKLLAVFCAREALSHGEPFRNAHSIFRRFGAGRPMIVFSGIRRYPACPRRGARPKGGRSRAGGVGHVCGPIS
jgi:hypothetical protein